MSGTAGAPRAGRPPHPHARLRRDGRRSRTILDHVERPDRPRRHRDHRPRADRRGRRRPVDGARPRACGPRSSSARRSRRCGGHLLALFVERPIRPYRSLRDDDRSRSTTRAAWRSRPTRSCPYPLCAQGWILRRLLDDPDPSAPPGRPRDLQPDEPRQAVASRGSSASPTSTASPGSATATPMRSRRSASGWTTFPGRDAADLRRAIETRTTDHDGTFHEHGRPARHVRAAASQARPRRPRRGRRPCQRDGTGRDHGYPGGRLRPPRFDADDAREVGRR